MSQTAVLVWLSVAELFGPFRADLQRFSESHLILLEPPPTNAGATLSPYAPDLAAQVEQALDEARTATGALDQPAALSALERAERLLTAHPELPQAAWLMAERLGLAAELEASAPEGAEAALALRRHAASLEGARAEPFSDHAATSQLEAPSVHAIGLDGPAPDDVVEWDGVRQAGAALTSADGEHQVRVLRRGRLLWASWLHVAASDVALHLAVPPVTPCSSDDLAPAHFEGDRAVAAQHASCPSYVLARPHPGGGVDVALCQRDECGRTSRWVALAPAATAAITPTRWPLWATYATASAMVLGTGLLMWHAGVFDRPEARTQSSWVYGGATPAARF